MTTYTSTQSGLWSSNSTWGGAGHPVYGDLAIIAANHVVEIGGDTTLGSAPTNDTTMVLTIQNLGHLKWKDNPTADWTFTINGNVDIQKGGKWSVGTPTVPVPATRTAIVSFPSVNTTGWKIQVKGTFEVYGAENYHMASGMQRSTLKYALMQGTGTTFKLNDPVDWQVGDYVSVCNRNDYTHPEKLAIASKIDASTYTVSPTYCHLAEDFVVLVNRNVQFIGYDNAGKGVSIVTNITTAADCDAAVVNLSWCSFKFFGRNTYTADEFQFLFYRILIPSGMVGKSIPDTNFKLTGVIVDDLSNNQPNSSIHVETDLAFTGSGYKLDGVHFTGTGGVRYGVHACADGFFNMRNVSMVCLYVTGNGIKGRWGNCSIDGFWGCGEFRGSQSSLLIWFFTSIKNCLLYGSQGYKLAQSSNRSDNSAYMGVLESVVDNCKFYGSYTGVTAWSLGVNPFSMVHSLVVKNCDFWACFASSVSTYGLLGKLRMENCTVDGVGDYLSTDRSPISLGRSGEGNAMALSSVVVAKCTFGRYAVQPKNTIIFDGMSGGIKVSMVACEVFQPYAVSDPGYHDIATFNLFRYDWFSNYTDLAERWRAIVNAPMGATGCTIWKSDGSGIREVLSAMEHFRHNLLSGGSGLRHQRTNIESGTFSLRLVPFSNCVDADINRARPLEIVTAPNKNLAVSIRAITTGTLQRTRASLRMFGPGIFSKARQTALAGVWETLTVQGNCNPDLTEGIKHVPDLVTNLVGYWAINNNVLDSHTNALNGTVEGAALTYVAGRLDRAADLNGSSQCVNLGTSALLNPTNITVCAWVRSDTGTGYQMVIGKRCEDALSNQAWWLMISNGSWIGGVATAGAEDSMTGPTANTGWHHVAMTYDGTTISFWFDGIRYSKTHSSPGNIRANATVPALIGAQVTTPIPSGRYRWFDGKIDDVCMFDRTLTPIEMVSIYRLGRGLRYELVRQYLDTSQVQVVMSAGANNMYLPSWSTDNNLYPGRAHGIASQGPNGMQDWPTIQIYTDIDRLAVVESDIV